MCGRMRVQQVRVCERAERAAAQPPARRAPTHTSGTPSRPSTGVCATRSTQSWIASVMWGTTCCNRGGEGTRRYLCMPTQGVLRVHGLLPSQRGSLLARQALLPLQHHALSLHQPASIPCPASTDLHRLPQVVSPPLALNHSLVVSKGRGARGAGQEARGAWASAGLPRLLPSCCKRKPCPCAVYKGSAAGPPATNPPPHTPGRPCRW